MRKLAILVTVLLLCGVLALMLVSVGVIPLPRGPQQIVRQATALPMLTSVAKETSDYTADIRPKLYVDVPIGQVNVRGAEVDQVQITMIAEAKAAADQRAEEILDGITLDLTTTNSENRLIVRIPKNLGNGEEARADLNIFVPRETIVEAHLALGDVHITNIQGDLRVDANLGSITVRDFTGNARLKAALGDISVSASAFAERLTAASDLGSVEVEASLAKSNVLEARLGDLRLHLRPDESYVLEGKVDLGGIYVGTPFEGQQTEKSIKGTIGRGEPRGTISASVALGSLRISN